MGEASPWEDVEVVAAPALSMLLGSVFALVMRVPEKIQACSQNFSAGLLISAVAAELYPLMSPKELSRGESITAVACGFAVGLAFMFGLDHLTEGDEDDEEQKEDGEKRRDSELPMDAKMSRLDSMLSAPMLNDEESCRALGSYEPFASALVEDAGSLTKSVEEGKRDTIDRTVHDTLFHVHQAERQLSLTGPLAVDDLERMKFHCGELQTDAEELGNKGELHKELRALKKFKATLKHIHKHAERRAGKFKRWQPAPMIQKQQTLDLSGNRDNIPWPLVAGVVADGAVDGLLIGLAFAASPGAGWAMSIATCIEMGFLGLSFSATISTSTRSVMKMVFVALLPPLLLMTTGVIGTHVGDALHANKGVFVGFIGFAVVCLLFLVTQELLVEAHEVGGDSAVINVMFFVGLLGGIMLEGLVG
jgi:zinc transporter ZupT